MLRSSANVQRAVQPLFFCLPERPACYREAGPEVVSVIEQERRAVDIALQNTDDPCLEEVARLYRSSLDEYGSAGRAATIANVAAVDSALAKTTELEISYTEKMGTCGFAEGEMAEAGARLRKTSSEMLRLEQEFATCLDEACIIDVAAHGRQLARDGASTVDEMVTKIGQRDDVPLCAETAFGEWKEAFGAVERAMAALQRLDVAAAEREAKQASELESEAQEDLADCMGSAGL